MEESLHNASSGMNFRNARRMRKNATEAEAVQWEILRGRKIAGCKFRRQHPIKAYIADFYCHELKMVIELDGAYHLKAEQMQKDAVRDKTLSEQNISCLRISNETLLHHTEKCMEDIIAAINELKKNRH